MNTKEKGHIAEQFIKNFLTKYGYKFIEENFNCKTGEIDLIMQEKNQIVFIEVKSLNIKYFKNIFSSITKNKKKRLLKAINFWLLKHDLLKSEWRVDFAGVSVESKKHVLLLYEKYIDMNI